MSKKGLNKVKLTNVEICEGQGDIPTMLTATSFHAERCGCPVFHMNIFLEDRDKKPFAFMTMGEDEALSLARFLVDAVDAEIEERNRGT